MHAFLIFIFNRNEARILTNNPHPLHVRMFPKTSVCHFPRLKSGQAQVKKLLRGLLCFCNQIVFTAAARY